MRSIKNLVYSIKNKSMPSAHAVERSLEKIKKQDKDINSFVYIAKDPLEQLGKIDHEKDLPLLGVPISIKDMFCVKGMPTTACSKILKNFICPYSATIIHKLINAGAIIMGKNNCDEFAMGSNNETSCFGTVKNPWNKKHTAGGSSGGSAASVADDMVYGSIGTDTGGSVRQPASFCGVVGLKPTYGRVSRYGMIAFASSLDQAGPIANNVTDAALLAKVISGYDHKDSTTVNIPVPNWDQDINTDLKGLTIGVLKHQDIHEEIKSSLDETKKILKDLGCSLVNIELKHAKYAVPTYYLICTSEASSNLARYDGVRFGLRKDNTMNFISKTRSSGFGKEVKLRIMMGTLALSSGYYEEFYLKASRVRRLIKNDFDKCFSKCDVILSPVTSGLAFKHGEIKDKLELYWDDYYTVPANLAGIPSISLPIKLSKNNLPVSIQLMAKQFKEQTLFNVAKAIEGVCQFTSLQ